MAIPNIAEIAALIGEESRAAMLLCLLGGKALPAGELARAARVTPQTASSHLAKMVERGLLVTAAQGRHRYYRLANPAVGLALEALNAIAPPQPVRSLRQSDQSKALHFARTCYDHVAGEVGVTLTDRWVDLSWMTAADQDYVLSADGAQRLREFGVDVDLIRHGRRHFARRCLDWSERRYHVAGALGAAVAERMFALDWMQRVPGARALRLTESGLQGMQQEFGIVFEQRAVANGLGVQRS